jgi:ribosomal protein S18 acetylase RimI-like enzyme
MVELRMVPAHDPAVATFLRERGMTVVARRGELVDALARPAIAAIEDHELAGVLSYDVGPIECEILTLYVAKRRVGVGSALVRRIAAVATAAGCRRCWLVTTNDNVDALRFYQRRGFHLTTIRCGAMAEARRLLKPQIPMTGEYGIPLRDELELVHDLVL